jgi:hypothetical protein
MYKLLKDSLDGRKFVRRISDMACIPVDPDNQDFVEYQKWLDAGNVPLPADEPNA